MVFIIFLSSIYVEIKNQLVNLGFRLNLSLLSLTNRLQLALDCIAMSFSSLLPINKKPAEAGEKGDFCH